MVLRNNHIIFPNSNAKMKTLTRSFNGAGYGSVLLDGGHGGQSSYHSIDDYIKTTNNSTNNFHGNGLADMISPKLGKLNIGRNPINGAYKQKIKNITLSI